MPHTGPVRQPPKLGSTKAAAQVAATILAKRIKVRTLVVHVETDKWLLVDNARKAAKAVDGAGAKAFA